jgi:hypothetical protein
MRPVEVYPQEADCTGIVHPMAIEGFRLFNQGHYWEAHEALETVWRDEEGEIRHLYQGVLQVGVTYLHITRKNFPGAVKVYSRCQRLLIPFPPVCRGVQIGLLREDAARAMAEVVRLGPNGLDQFDLALLKPLDWEANA